MKHLLTIAWAPGLALLLAGGLTNQFHPAWNTWASTAALLGAALLAAWAYTAFGAIQQVAARRSTRYGLQVALSVVLLLAVLTLVELISTQNNKRVDLTEGRRYTLSDQTTKVLKSLPTQVKAVAFFRPPSSQAFEDRRSAEDLLRRYADLSSRFRFEFVDPDANPAQAQRYKVTQYGTVVLEAAATAETAVPAPTPAQPVGTPAPAVAAGQVREEQITDLDEEHLTNALLKVTRGGKRVMYFVVGHGERAINETGKDGYSNIKALIEKANYEPKDLLLLRQPAVPADAGLVVVAGPHNAFAPQELSALKDYVGRGGKLLVLLDPGVEVGLQPFLQQYGILAGNDAVIDVDPASALFGGSELAPVITRFSPSSPITRDFKNMAAIFPLTRSVDTAPKAPEGVSLDKLAETSPQSFRGQLSGGTVRANPKTDQKAAVPVAVIATIAVKPSMPPGDPKAQPAVNQTPEAPAPKAPAAARIVAFGSSSFPANNYVGAFGNRDLFMNTVSWLADEEDQISIRPREAKSTPIFMTAPQAKIFQWVPVALLPLAIILAGSTVWVRRRR